MKTLIPIRITSNLFDKGNGAGCIGKAFTLMVSAACILNTGCGTTGGSISTTASAGTQNSAAPSAEQQFVAPNDPQMGQIVVAIPRVAVSAPVSASTGDLGQLVRSQLADCLSSSPNFLVADRETLQEIGEEHTLAAAGATDSRDRPAKGRLAGPRYLIKVDVTEFKEEVAGHSQGAGIALGAISSIIGGFVLGDARTAMDVVSATNPRIGGGKENVHGLVGFELRIIDVDTGIVIRATRASASLTRQNTRIVFGIAGINFSDSKFQQSVVAQAMRLAVQDATLQVHSILRERVSAQTARAEISKAQ